MDTGEIIIAVIVCLVGLIFVVGVIYDIVSTEIEYRKKKIERQKQIETQKVNELMNSFKELYSKYLCSKIDVYTLEENNLKLEKENIRLRNRIKKIKGEKK